jgi:hypothetical protein
MIEPNHRCYWSAHRVTKLTVEEGRLVAAGTSLPVILEAFRTQPYRWYLRLDGDVHRGAHEDLLLVAVPAARVDLPCKPPTSGSETINGALRGQWTVAECVLTPQVSAALGLVEPSDDHPHYSWARGPDCIQCLITIHDDCFAAVEPVDPPVMERLVRATLALHEYYLGHSVHWGEVSEEIVSLLTAGRELQIRSEPQGGRLVLEPPRAMDGPRSLLPAPPPYRMFSVSGGRATIRWRRTVR